MSECGPELVRAGDDLWFRVPLGGGWAAEYRLAVVSGRIVFGELRIRPDDPTPPGGIDAALLRSVRIGQHRELLVAEVRRAVVEGVKDPTALVGLEIDRRLFTDNTDALNLLVAEAAQHRKERGDLYYARLAARYAELVAAGYRRPTPVIAAEIRRPRSYVTAAISDARKRGLLTKTSRGRVGGELTAKARRLLARAEKGGTT